MYIKLRFLTKNYCFYWSESKGQIRNGKSPLGVHVIYSVFVKQDGPGFDSLSQGSLASTHGRQTLYRYQFSTQSDSGVEPRSWSSGRFSVYNELDIRPCKTTSLSLKEIKEKARWKS